MSKYRAQPVEIDGIRFASKAEGRRYSQLKILRQANEIRDLALQPQFPIVIKGKKIGKYTADFAYTDRRSGKYVVEDVKGYKTQVYKLRKKIVEALYGITITEVVRP